MKIGVDMYGNQMPVGVLLNESVEMIEYPGGKPATPSTEGVVRWMD